MSALPLRVMLVDDHEVVRDGIRLLLNEAEDVVVRRGRPSARRGSWPSPPRPCPM